MKLFLDQNLSYKLALALQPHFEQVVHVRDVNLQQANDWEIWTYARKNSFTILTQDADFYEMSLINGFPPKVIWIRCGNTSTAAIGGVLLNNLEGIRMFIQSDQFACYELA